MLHPGVAKGQTKDPDKIQKRAMRGLFSVTSMTAIWMPLEKRRRTLLYVLSLHPLVCDLRVFVSNRFMKNDATHAMQLHGTHKY